MASLGLVLSGVLGGVPTIWMSDDVTLRMISQVNLDLSNKTL